MECAVILTVQVHCEANYDWSKQVYSRSVLENTACTVPECTAAFTIRNDNGHDVHAIGLQKARDKEDRCRAMFALGLSEE